MPTKYNSSITFPTDNYIIRCVEEKFAPSNSGSPMITLEFEIDSPETVNVAGEDVTVAGVKVKHYAVTKSLSEDGEVDVEKTKACEERVFVSSHPDRPSLYELFGEDGTKIDRENPALVFKGKRVHVTLGCDIRERRKSPTPEQAKRGQPGDVLLNPVSGKPQVSYYPKINQIWGLAQ